MNLLAHYERRRLMPKSAKGPTSRDSVEQTALSNLLRALESGALSTVQVDCPVCGCSESEQIASIDRRRLPVRTVRCFGCPTLYSRFRLTEDSLRDFYESYYRTAFGGMREPTFDWFESQTATGRRILAEIQSFPQFKASLKGRRVLEIGTGAGGVLIPFKESGAQVIGLDLDENFLEFGRSRGLDLRFGGVDSVQNVGPVDIVILKDVLEHLPNPLRALKDIRQILSDDGVLYVHVPGLQSLGSLGYLNDLLRYLQIAHLCHYTEESLVFLCEKADLRVVQSNRLATVMCVRGDENFANVQSRQPGPEAAVIALREIFRSRLISRLRHEIRSVIPEPVRALVRNVIR